MRVALCEVNVYEYAYTYVYVDVDVDTSFKSSIFRKYMREIVHKGFELQCLGYKYVNEQLLLC